MILFIVSAVTAIMMTSGQAFAYGDDVTAPSKPEILLSDAFLQAQARLSEPSTSSIDLPLWRLGVKTNFASWVGLEASVGATSLFYRPNWSASPTEQVGLVEGKATLRTLFGDFFAGQFRIPWGLEGGTDEEFLWLPRSLLYEKGYFPLLDVGAGFHTDLDGFYMNVVVHNGEGAGVAASDNRYFLTGQWGFMGPAHINAGLSMTAGRVTPPNLVTTESRIRAANAFFGFNIFGLGLQLEGSIFQNISAGATTNVVAWHADAQHPVTDHLNLIARYEQLNPGTTGQSNILGRGFFGGEYHSRNNISRLFLFLVKNNESLQESPNDEIRLIWRVSPSLED